MTLKQKIVRIIGVSVSIVMVLAPTLTQAATMSARPLTTKVEVGGVFTVSVDLNSQGKAINSAEAVISFPTDVVEVQSLSTGGSVFSIWVEPATFSNGSGTITFNGGAPSPGYTGSSGHILSAKFRAKASGTAQISISSAAIRENDGLGTNVLTGQSGGQISISEQKEATPSPAEPSAPTTPTTSTSDVRITSVTHPNSEAWYKETKAIFAWRLPAGTTASQTSLDKTQNTIPRVLRRPAVNTITVDNIASGVWYFNARFQNATGWTKVYSYKIQVDTVAPDSVVIINSNNNSAPMLSAQDALSGIDYFEVEVDGAKAVKIIPTGKETPIDISGISTGTHSVKAIAYDLAGNFTATTAKVEFPQSGSVTITDFSKTIREGKRIIASGVGPENSTVNITLVTQEGISRIYTASTTSSGKFTFQSEPISGTGTYEMWAQAVLPTGNLGATSAHVQIEVNPSAVTRFGSMFRSLLTVSNVIILILSILCILGWLNYFLLKKSLKSGIRRKNPKSSLGEKLDD